MDFLYKVEGFTVCERRGTEEGKERKREREREDKGTCTDSTYIMLTLKIL